MKKNTLLILSMLCFALATNPANAQDGYTYTLVDNGSYSYTISAVPNASSSNFATSVQSYGFTIIVSDGITATIMSSLGSGATATPFDGNDVGQPTMDGYLITETLGSPASLPAPSAVTNSPMVSIQVNDAPTSGTISVLANNSELATAVTPLKSFMQADMVDNDMVTYTNVVDPNASALSGTTSYNFSTLGIEENIITKVAVSVYPNPASDKIHIVSNQTINSIAVYDILGKQVMSIKGTKEIDISELNSGLYLFKITSGNEIHIKKIIVN